MAADVGQEQLEAVRGADDDVRIGRLRLDGLRLLLGPRLADLEADGLELARELLHVCVVEVVLEREGLELGRLDMAALFGGLDEGAGALSLEKLGNLLVRQLRFLFLSLPCGFLHCKTALGHRTFSL